MNLEQLVKWALAGEPEVLGETSPVLLFPSQIPHGLTLDRTRAAMMGIKRTLIFL
jgi:hypothetical protein